MTPIVKLALRALHQCNDYIEQTVSKREIGPIDLSSSQTQDSKIIAHLESVIFQNLFDSLKKGYPKHYLAEPGEVIPEDKEDAWQVLGINNPDSFLNKGMTSTYSLAHFAKGKVKQALLINPFSREEFVAVKGSGATLNDRRIRVGSVKSLSDARVTSNILSQLSQQDSSNSAMTFLSDLINETKDISSSNNPSLDIAHVAAGQKDLSVLINQEVSDLSAALVMSQESGALVGTLNGEPLKSKGKQNIVVANPKLYKLFVQRFAGYAKKL